MVYLPTGQLSIDQDYTLSEASGISSITFTGTATSVAYDPNNANIPVGGYVVSVGSTSGLGYQPLVSAGGTLLYQLLELLHQLVLVILVLVIALVFKQLMLVFILLHR